MNIEQIALDDTRIGIVENMLTDIKGVTPDSYYNNERREVPTTFYLGYGGQTPICVIETYSEKQGELFLTNFGIDEDVQLSGYGRQFIVLFENLAKEKGYGTIRLTSHPDSYGFYLKCGYEPHGKWEYGLLKVL